MPGPARPQVLPRPDRRGAVGERALPARLLRPEGGAGFQGHGGVRGQPHQPAVEEGVQGDQGREGTILKGQ